MNAASATRPLTTPPPLGSCARVALHAQAGSGWLAVVALRMEHGTLGLALHALGSCRTDRMHCCHIWSCGSLRVAEQIVLQGLCAAIIRCTAVGTMVSRTQVSRLQSGVVGHGVDAEPGANIRTAIQLVDAALISSNEFIQSQEWDTFVWTKGSAARMLSRLIELSFAHEQNFTALRKKLCSPLALRHGAAISLVILVRLSPAPHHQQRVPQRAKGDTPATQGGHMSRQLAHLGVVTSADLLLRPRADGVRRSGVAVESRSWDVKGAAGPRLAQTHP